MKAKISAQLMWLTAWGVAAFIGGGCATYGRQGHPEGGDEVGGARLPFSEAGRLNVLVVSRGEETAGRLVQQKVEGVLAGKGFAVDPELPADLRVDLGVETWPFDRSGNYYVYEGRVDALVTRTHDARIVGRQMINGRGERRLGETLAVQSLGEVLARSTAEWAARAIMDGTAELAVVDITVYRPWRAWYQGSDLAEYARLFVKEAKSTEGVISCRLIRQDLPSRSLVFRVVYTRDRVPEGILNRLANRPKLELRPR